MTYREFVNMLSDEEFAQTIIDDVLLHMACDCTIENGVSKCPYEGKDCLKCVVKLLKEEIENNSKN